MGLIPIPLDCRNNCTAFIEGRGLGGGGGGGGGERRGWGVIWADY